MNFSFAGLHGCPSICDVEVYPLADEQLAIVVTELPENPGTSVTNAWPELADMIVVRRGIHPNRYVRIYWFEHYPQRFKRPESFDRVYLDLNDGQQPERHLFIMCQSRHPWQAISRDEVERILGGPVHA